MSTVIRENQTEREREIGQESGAAEDREHVSYEENGFWLATVVLE